MVKFSLEDINPIEFGPEDIGLSVSELEKLDGKIGVITGVAIADPPFGNKDYEYYDISFGYNSSFGDITMEAVSGYHLEMVHKA